MQEICKMIKKNFNFLILVFTILYTIIFGFYFLRVGNFEFLWYVGILSLLIISMALLHKKFKFSSSHLVGASLWGFLHMLGGSVHINGKVLYDVILLNIYNSTIEGLQILKYDQFMHFYTYLVVTFLLYHVLKKYLKNQKSAIISIMVVFASMGVGASNEIVEFIPVLLFYGTGVGGYYNTLLDLVFNTLGAIIAMTYIYFSGKL